MDPLVILPIGMAVVAGGILLLRLHAFLALIAGALVVGWLGSARALEAWAVEQELEPEALKGFLESSVIERVTQAFGESCGKYGILIAMASLIGMCLLESGGAERIVRSLMGFFGERKTHIAFTSGGFLLGIPVFFDTVFYLMVPLARTLALRQPRRHLLLILSVSAGATMSHSLVPPTPGPLYMVEVLEVRMTTLMLGGLLVGGIAAASGLCFAHLANRWWPLPLRPVGSGTLERLHAQAGRSPEELPPLGFSLLPIVLPVVLIALLSLFASSRPPGGGEGSPPAFLALVGDRNMALILGAVAGIGLYLFSRRSGDPPLADLVPRALGTATVIVFITSAGGAFGVLLGQSGIGPRLGALAEGTTVWILPLAFVLTALVRTAQGSATVAMITAAAVLAPLATADRLGFHPVYLALAIGCGSKPYSWMNDSGFWIVSRMTGMTEKEMLRSWSLMLALMGLSGLLVVMIGARYLPLTGS